ncbi:spermine/spermidine N-acetyltransferase [Chitinophaga sp. YR627]|uniref:N-acetyltransferase n=1 Tax=Chitinophaga sp. YR627 TaxID=1881041 RepID=UPI0008E9DF24|nr:N-acetyltransferase [Chitinophaga sp. YR627]SFO54554.1 spermine/spermidine N-acetyltransferase [Chitinophaga sp. YR627]
MANRIVINFCIGTEQDRRTLSFIGRATAREKFSGKVPETEITAYIERNFSDHTLRGELNNISNQILVVFVDGEVAGYARVTTKGERPEIFQGKSVARIADFSVLERYHETATRKQLFEKCLCICKTKQVIWISEHEGTADMDLFTANGFIRSTAISGVNDLGLPLVYLIKE